MFLGRLRPGPGLFGLRLLSKRARQPARPAAPAAQDAREAATEALVNDRPSDLVLFFSDKQMHARAMAMAAGVQGVLGVAWTDSLWLVKNKLAEEEELRQIADGLPDAHSVWYDHMEWWDWALGSAIWLSPFLLLLATRYSTMRWIHSLTLLPGQMTRVVSYSMIGSQKQRVLPNSAIMRAPQDSRLFIEGKNYLLPDKGTWFEKDAFHRVYKRKD